MLMIMFYVDLITTGEITLENVPERRRAAVIKELENLEE